MDALEVSDVNVRRREITADLDELAKSLDQFGLQQPVVVEPKGDRYAILPSYFQSHSIVSKQPYFH